jgi:hypothetical protein
MVVAETVSSRQHPHALLGLDIGGINTRATLFGIASGNYQVLASEGTLSSRGKGLHIGDGVEKAIQSLQAQSEHFFLEESGALLMPVDRIGRGVDRVAMVVSAGERIRAGLIGLTQAGSLMAGKALFDSLPVQLTSALMVADLENETRCIEALVQSRPELLVILGGENNAAAASSKRWIEITRTVCGLLPQTAQPNIIYAGDPDLEATARRRLEPVAKLKMAPNLQPLYGEYDLVPAQSLLEQEILRIWQAEFYGLTGLLDLSRDLNGITGRSLDRMVRFLSLLDRFEQTRDLDSIKTNDTGVLAVDLGGKYTTMSAGLGGLGGSVVLDKFPNLGGKRFESACLEIHAWVGEGVTREEVDQFLGNHALMPSWVPETRKELALTQAFARYRLKEALARLAENHTWVAYHPDRGLDGNFVSIIASGAVVTHAPNPVELMLALLDGIQPRGITTIVIDRHHLLPLLGKIGEAEPVLPVHILTSRAFGNLGTVVSAVSDLRQGKTALTVHVETGSGEVYTADIHQGTLRRLVIPPGISAMLDFVPHRKVDIGFGGRGQGGRLKVTGGMLSVVVDARGRPVQYAEDEAGRIEQKRQWLQTLGDDHA